MSFPSRSTSLHTDAAGTAPPDAFGPFRVLHQIGAGALGPVFRAYDPDQDRLVAVKWFRLDLPPERTHRLVAELEQLIACDLTHPVLATPLATGIVSAAAYLAQDFVAADSVDLLIRQHGAMPQSEALRITASLASALDAAVQLQIVHAALHPRDVLVSADDVRLTGLGIARALERAGSAAPTRRPYTAPERAAGVADGDPRADVFSLAVLVHEWLWAKRVSGVGGEAAEALTALPGADLSRLRSLFACALAEDPGDRFATARQFADGLALALTQGSPSAPRISAPIESRLPLDEAEEAEEPAIAAAPAQSASVDLALRRVVAPPTPAVDPPVREQPIAAVPAAVDPPPRRPAIDRTPAVESVNTAFQSTRSAVWPLGLALVLGASLGFAAGYEVATRQRGSGSELPTAAASAPELERAVQGNVDAPPAPLVPVAAAATPAGSGSASPRSSVGGAPVAPVGAVPAPSAGAAARAPDRSPAASSPATGRLLVRSTPAGARVMLDGEDVGQTPLTMRALAPGAHTVRLVRDGYIASEQRVMITAERPAQSVIITLARASLPAASAGGSARPRAAIVVESRPAGANVFLDGKLVGRTPLQIGEVAPGEHEVRLELDGYRGWSSSVRLAEGERGRVAASLDR